MGNMMDINEDLMALYDTGLKDVAQEVVLIPEAEGRAAVTVKVLPCLTDQAAQTATMLYDAMDLKDLLAEVLDTDFGQGVASQAQLAGRLVDLLEKAPEMYAAFKELLGPNVPGVDLGRLRIYDFAKVAVAFVTSSLKAQDGRGWAGLGKDVGEVMTE